jgi:hypothetical protein
MYQQQPQQQPQSRFAFFSNNDPSKNYIASLIINITPELLQEMLQLAQASNWAVNQYGQLEAVKLSGWMYNNDGKFGGNVSVAQPRQQQPYQQPPQAAFGQPPSQQLPAQYQQQQLPAQYQQQQLPPPPQHNFLPPARKFGGLT